MELNEVNDPVEAVDDCLGRIERSESLIRAWVTVDAEGATQRAIELAGSERVGPLWGVPVGIKDIIDVAGLPTTAGSRVLQNNVATQDAPVVSRLKEAGAIILGKTNTQEFAYGTVTAPTSNPWDTTRIPGGSSGGSAAALAAEHCIGALGTDTGGSIRIPAALCGVSGLKPRNGLVSLEGIVPLAPSLDAVGPMARDAVTLKRLWEALIGRSARVSPDDVVLAVPNDGALPGDIDDEVTEAFEVAVDKFRYLGHKIEHAEVPRWTDFDRPRGFVLMKEALEVHRARGWWPEHADDYNEETRRTLEFTETMQTEGGLEGARARCKELAAGLRGFLGTAQVLLTPTLQDVAPTKQEAVFVPSPGGRASVSANLTRIPGPVNVAGLAAISIPCGFSRSGLPIGLQMIADDEDLLIDLAIRYQAVTEWHSATAALPSRDA